MSLTSEQERVADAIETFLARPRANKRYFTFHGLAGVGKTHLLTTVARKHPASVLCSFTGKAASVLRNRSGLDVKTLHSAIYDFLGTKEDEEGKKQPIFSSKEDAGLGGVIVFLDECSSVGVRLAEDLLATNARVIACGDPGQLGPVRDSQFFEDADFTLTEIHRQALESAVIRQAHRVRAGHEYRPDGSDFTVLEKWTPAELIDADVLLCWRNATRRLLNGAKRHALGIKGKTLLAGEPVMCLRNDHRLKIYNGEIYPLAADRAPGEDAIIQTSGGPLPIQNVTVEGADPEFDDLRDVEEMTPFALAYAATVHKFQGSEAPNVLLVDEHPMGDAWKQLTYTGITRAAKRVTVVRR